MLISQQFSIWSLKSQVTSYSEATETLDQKMLFLQAFTEELSQSLNNNSKSLKEQWIEWRKDHRLFEKNLQDWQNQIEMLENSLIQSKFFVEQMAETTEMAFENKSALASEEPSFFPSWISLIFAALIALTTGLCRYYGLFSLIMGLLFK